MVQLALGALDAQRCYGDLFTQVQINALLRGQLEQQLEGRFGLPTEEAVKVIEASADEYFAR